MKRFTNIVSNIAAIAALGVSTLVAAPAFATATYHYSGHHATNSEGTVAFPWVPLHAPMTFDFTVATPLAANLVDVDLFPTVLSWTASAGTALSTITSTDPNPMHLSERIRLSTDAAGDITTYNIVVSGSVVDLTTEVQFLFERLLTTSTQSAEQFKGFVINNGQIFVGATCSGTGGCGGAPNFPEPTFARVADLPVDSVPAPAAWGLMLAGLGLVGGGTRRRALQPG